MLEKILCCGSVGTISLDSEGKISQHNKLDDETKHSIVCIFPLGQSGHAGTFNSMERRQEQLAHLPGSGNLLKPPST